MFLLVVMVIAAVTYVMVRAMDQRSTPRSEGRYQAPFERMQRQVQSRLPRRQQGRPVAPDDDEEFLRELDRKRMGNDPDN